MSCMTWISNYTPQCFIRCNYLSMVHTATYFLHWIQCIGTACVCGLLYVVNITCIWIRLSTDFYKMLRGKLGIIFKSFMGDNGVVVHSIAMVLDLPLLWWLINTNIIRLHNIPQWTLKRILYIGCTESCHLTTSTGIILCMRPANEIRRYTFTKSMASCKKDVTPLLTHWVTSFLH